jgi:hypothetical protein
LSNPKPTSTLIKAYLTLINIQGIKKKDNGYDKIRNLYYKITSIHEWYKKQKKKQKSQLLVQTFSLLVFDTHNTLSLELWDRQYLWLTHNRHNFSRTMTYTTQTFINYSHTNNTSHHSPIHTYNTTHALMATHYFLRFVFHTH